MDFLKGLQNFDVEKVLESATNAVQAVDEFPGASQPQSTWQKRGAGPEIMVTAGAVNRARMAQSAWEQVRALFCGWFELGDTSARRYRV